MTTAAIAGRTGCDVQATPATEYGESTPVVFLSMNESGVPLSAANGMEEELTIPAAKALVAQLRNAIDVVEAEHTWTDYPGQGGTLKVHDLIAIEDDPLFSLYVEQEDHRTFTLSFSQAQKLIDQLTRAMENYRGSDRRPTPGCPTWCNYHRDDCDGWHFGKLVVNDIEVEIEWDQADPDFGAPRVDMSGIDWVNGPALTDLAEALHKTERILGVTTPDDGSDCD